MPLELALNQAWGVKKERGFLHKRIIAALMALLCGYLILMSVFATIMLGRVAHFLHGSSKDQWISIDHHVTLEIVLVLISFILTVVHLHPNLQNCALHTHPLCPDYSSGHLWLPLPGKVPSMPSLFFSVTQTIKTSMDPLPQSLPF